MCYFQIVKFELHKERKLKNKYQAEAQTRYQVVANPSPSKAVGDEHRRFWVVDTEQGPYFVAPGIIMRGFDNEEEAERYRASL
jgi:hypothetical protein